MWASLRAEAIGRAQAKPAADGGAPRLAASDIDPRAVACAKANAERLKLGARFSVALGEGFPEGKADVIICNPPWVPEPAKNRVDRAVFDEDNRFLRSFLSGLAAHLNEGGQGLLLISDLAVLLGLRSPQWLEEQFAATHLQVKWKKSVAARHPKANTKSDPLYAVRRRELTTLYSLVPDTRGGPCST